MKLVKCPITVLVFCLTMIISAPVATADSFSPTESEESTKERASRFDPKIVVTRGDQSQRSNQVPPEASALRLVPSGVDPLHSNEKLVDMHPIIASFLGLSFLLFVVVAFASRSRGKRIQVIHKSY